MLIFKICCRLVTNDQDYYFSTAVLYLIMVLELYIADSAKN